MREEFSDELFETFDILVDPKQTPIRLDKFLIDRTPNLSRNRIQNAIKAGSILVDGSIVKPNHRVKPQQHISVVMPKPYGDETGLIPERIPLDIRYEDEEILIVHKPAGMVVHPGIGHRRGTLVNALAGYLRYDDLPVMPGNHPNRVGLVHRIDRETSGLLVIAKTDFAMTHLAKQFYDHTIDRKYLAIVWGTPEPLAGRIDLNLIRDARYRTKYTTTDDREEGKWAISHYRTVESFYYTSLVEMKLETGRTHQIRVHMSSQGHPLFNDPKYGGDRIVKGTIYSKYKAFVENNFSICSRHALHAKSLTLTHPTTGQRMFFDSELPQDMYELAARWREYIHNRKEL